MLTWGLPICRPFALAFSIPDRTRLRIIANSNWHEYTPRHETTVYTLDENGNPVSSETTSDTTESGYSRKTAEYIYEYYAVAP